MWWLAAGRLWALSLLAVLLYTVWNEFWFTKTLDRSAPAYLSIDKRKIVQRSDHFAHLLISFRLQNSKALEETTSRCEIEKHQRTESLTGSTPQKVSLWLLLIITMHDWLTKILLLTQVTRKSRFSLQLDVLTHIRLYNAAAWLVPEIGSLESDVDDPKLFLSFPVKDADVVALQITEDLKKIAAWFCHINSLLINPEKTKVLLLGTRQMLKKVPNGFCVILLEKELLPIPSAKDLGVQVDETLSYDEHITNTVSGCIARLCQINRIKYIFDTEALLNIINTLVFSKLYYCFSVWSNTSNKNILKLQSVLKFAARIVSGARKYDHIIPVLKECQQYALAQRCYLSF